MNEPEPGKRIRVKGHYRSVTRDSKGTFTNIKKWKSSRKVSKYETLKNHPVLLCPDAPHYWKVNVSDPDAVSELLHELQEWFEGFEKELRELMHDKKRYGRMYVEIKGILGE